MSKKIPMEKIYKSLRQARSGRRLGLESETVNDQMTPRGNLSLSGQIKVVVQIGTTVADGGSNTETWVDIFGRGPTKRATGTESGVSYPDFVTYHRIVRYLSSNPGRLKSVQVQGSDASVIQDCSVAVVRRVPQGETVREKIPMSSYLDTTSQQLSIVTMPVNCELDASTFFRLLFPVGASARRVTLTFNFERIAEARDQVGEAGAA